MCSVMLTFIEEIGVYCESFCWGRYRVAYCSSILAIFTRAVHIHINPYLYIILRHFTNNKRKQQDHSQNNRITPGEQQENNRITPGEQQDHSWRTIESLPYLGIENNRRTMRSLELRSTVPESVVYLYYRYREQRSIILVSGPKLYFPYLQ